jgi:hypothetical protein
MRARELQLTGAMLLSVYDDGSEAVHGCAHFHLLLAVWETALAWQMFAVT